MERIEKCGNLTVQDFIPIYEFSGKEADVENHIIDNIHIISEKCGWGEIVKYKQQFHFSYDTGRVIVDIMIWHNDGTGTLIETKSTGRDKIDVFAAIGQCLFYGDRFYDLFGVEPRLVIATPHISPDIYKTIKRRKLPISLLMIDGDRCVYLA